MTDVLDQQWDEMSTLDACILIEETCTSIYYKYAGIFANSPKYLTLWTEMAIEEEKHADVFRAIRAIHCRDSNAAKEPVKTCPNLLIINDIKHLLR